MRYLSIAFVLFALFAGCGTSTSPLPDRLTITIYRPDSTYPGTPGFVDTTGENPAPRFIIKQWQSHDASLVKQIYEQMLALPPQQPGGGVNIAMPQWTQYLFQNSNILILQVQDPPDLRTGLIFGKKDVRIDPTPSLQHLLDMITSQPPQIYNPSNA